MAAKKPRTNPKTNPKEELAREQKVVEFTQAALEELYGPFLSHKESMAALDRIAREARAEERVHRGR